MTYISIIPRASLAASDDGHAIHQGVMRAFDLRGPYTRSQLGVLWREEPHERILIRSAVRPTALPEPGRTTPEPDLPGEGSAVGFWLEVSAVARTESAERRLADDEIPGWLAKRLDGALGSVRITELDRGTRKVTPSRGRRPFAIDRTRIAGVADIADRERLRAVLRNGLGRGKAHGAGLLTVLPTELLAALPIG